MVSDHKLDCAFVYDFLKFFEVISFDVQSDYIALGNENLSFFIPKSFDNKGSFHL